MNNSITSFLNFANSKVQQNNNDQGLDLENQEDQESQTGQKSQAGQGNQIDFIDKAKQKSVSISIVGRPNVGKSTLFNKILNKRLSPITHKRQTTQTILNGIKTIGDTQIIMWDTPGIFNQSAGKNRFVKLAWHALQSTDLVFVMISAVFKHDLLVEKRIIDNLTQKYNEDQSQEQEDNQGNDQNTNQGVDQQVDNNINKKIIICINKTDLTPNRLDELKIIFKDYQILPICALKNTAKDRILDICLQNAKHKPWKYDKNIITSLKPEFITNEITRKYILLNIHQEIPYSVEVSNVKFKEDEENVIIHQEILTKYARHKGIIIGQNAANIKNINIKSRQEIQSLFNKKVHLFIQVKSKK